MKIYHYLLAGNAQQSANEDQLASLVAAGTIKRETNVWTDGMAQWAPAGQVLPQLFTSSAGAPPPIPASAGGQRSHVIDFEIHGDDIIPDRRRPGESKRCRIL